MPNALTDERYYQILDEQYEEAMRDFLESSRTSLYHPDDQEVITEPCEEGSDPDLDPDLPF